MNVAKCQLILHDSLYYATREMGRLYETEKVIHNWALTYALGFIQKPYYCPDSVPTYQDDLQPINEAGVYVTPAKPICCDYVTNTFKFADNRHRTFSAPNRTNKPSYGKAKELAPESEFEFFIVGKLPERVPKWIRLGLWMSKAQIEITDCQDLTVQRGKFTCPHLLNPLDLSISPQLYDLISMPPVSLLQNATLTGEYVEFRKGKEIICLPATMRYFANST